VHGPDTGGVRRALYRELLLGPPKSKPGRIVGIPAAIIPDLRVHMAIYVKDEPGALVFDDDGPAGVLVPAC